MPIETHTEQFQRSSYVDEPQAADEGLLTAAGNRIPTSRIFGLLNAITAVVLFLYTFTVLAHHLLSHDLPQLIIQSFDINGEANVPTWYSTQLLFSVALASYFLFRLGKGEPGNRFWLGFSLAYAFFSLDEAAQIHETIGLLISEKWVLFYTPLTGLFFLACVYYVFRVRAGDAALRNWILGGLMVYAFGGLALEWLNYMVSLPFAWRQVSFVVEEGGEMLGTSMVLTGCLLELNKQLRNSSSDHPQKA